MIQGNFLAQMLENTCSGTSKYKKGQGSGKICLQSQGFTILRFFFIYFTIAGERT